MKRVLIATSNAGKLRDFSGVAARYNVEIAGIPDFSQLPEVVEDGLTGFIVRDDAQAIAAVDRVAGLDRRAIRRRFEERFSATAMATRYIDIYGRLAAPTVAKLNVAAE